MLERAEQSMERGYRELQYILLAEYQDKKLERQDTDISLVHNSIIEENNNANNQDNNNNDNDSNFIISDNLKLLPKLKKKENNMRYINNKKEKEIEEERNMKTTSRNFNVNTLSAPKLKYKTASKIYINAKNVQRGNNMTTSKIKNNYGERNNLRSITNRVKTIKPMNLKEKLIINAKNKVKY